MKEMQTRDGWLHWLADGFRLVAMSALACVAQLCYRVIRLCGRGVDALSVHDEEYEEEKRNTKGADNE